MIARVSKKRVVMDAKLYGNDFSNSTCKITDVEFLMYPFIPMSLLF